MIVNKSKFIKEQEPSGLLSSLGIKIPLSKIPLANTRNKMNEIVNNFLLTGDKFIPQMHLRQPGYTYTA